MDRLWVRLHNAVVTVATRWCKYVANGSTSVCALFGCPEALYPRIRSKMMLKAVGGPVMYMVAHYKTRKTLQQEYGFLPDADAKAELFKQMDGWIASFTKGQVCT